MNNQQPKDITYKKIAWTIRNYSTLKINTPHCSEVFTIGDCNWKVIVNRQTRDGKFLAIYLIVADASSLPPGWSIYADFTFTVVNQSSWEISETYDAVVKPTFSGANGVSWGPGKIIGLEVLEEPSNGFIFNDKCIIEVEFYEVEPAGFEPASHLTYPSSPNQSKKVLPENVGGGGDGKVDFKGLGRIEKPFVPLLEEVFSQYPSLLDCKNSRSHEFTEWVFNGLGRVLQFLKEKKLKDMKDEKACEQLQHLWKELKMSKLDFSWLEPDVKSALKMKVYEKKAEKVKKLKKNLKALETQIKELMEKVGGTEQTVEMIRKDLDNAVVVFEDKDFDA